MAEHNDAPVKPATSETGRAPAAGGPVVVGIGASAGGLRALKQLFATVPADSGLAFVVVVHLSPDHESHLADLLQAQCAIPVTQVTSETLMEPNRVYVIPPGRNLSAIDSHLRLAPMANARMGRAPVDHFFRTLAATHDGASVGVILSGSGSDGTSGIRYIRGHGGMVLAQDPHEAEYDGMSRSAIATGSVDLVLPIAEMMPQILEFGRTHPLITPGSDEVLDSKAGEAATDPLQTALTLVRLRTGHDFLRYKRSTVARRVSRRMQILNIETLQDYVELLRNDTQESATLLDDLLINVTSFFRDAEVFRTLETECHPQPLRGKGARRSHSRVVGGMRHRRGSLYACNASPRRGRTSHESSAGAGIRNRPSRAVAAIRPGGLVQRGMIEAEISPERLERFFRKESGGYRVMKELRDIVVFASHNLLRDPPFSKQDLIVCRNCSSICSATCRKKSSMCSTTRCDPADDCSSVPRRSWTARSCLR